MKKITVLLCMLCVLLTGCAENVTEYERSSEPGNLQSISLQEVYKKLEDKETFTLLMTQTTCFHCQEMLKELKPYLRSHEVLIYDLVLDKEGITSAAAWDEMIAKMNQYLDDFSGTPSIYYIEEGMKEDEIVGWGPDKNGKDEINIDTYDAFVQRHQLDALHK